MKKIRTRLLAANAAMITTLVMGAAVAAATVVGTICYADNPIIQTKYTADPAPMVFNDTVFLYTSHNEDDAFGFEMFNWMLYTSTDMVNWTDHGIIAGVKEPYKTFTWADGHSAWAPQCVARNGKFYLYCPTIYQGKMAIGVAVSNSPYGPFTDALGKPLIFRSNPGDYDPTVFIDDNGQAYMYWGGNGPCYYAKLKEDMISLASDIKVASIDFTGTPPEASYTEGPWLWKKNSHYYLAWASRCCPEGIGYAMSDSPTGPWKCKGTIMDPNERSSGNHPGIIDYKGNAYVFGFNYAILKQTLSKHYERRSICVEKMTYNADGTIQKLPWWSTSGASQVGNLNPYIRNEAETIAWESGVETEKRSNRGVYVTDIENGDYIKVNGIDFGTTGAGVFYASIASAANGGKIELHIDSLNGTLISSISVSYTGGWDNWKLETSSVNQATGINDLFLMFKGESGNKLFNFDFWKFEEKKSAHDLVAVNASIEKYKIDTVSGMNTLAMNVLAVYSDGTSKDISKSALISCGQEGIVNIGNGIITGINYGSTTCVVSYCGKTDTLYLLVKDYKSEKTVKRILADKDNINMFNESSLNLTITAEFLDGHFEDITNSAAYESLNPQVAIATDGTITAKAIGVAIITVVYKDEMGNAASLQVKVKVTNRNPFMRNEAEDYNEQSGIQTESCYDNNRGKDIGFIENGDWIKFNGVDFNDGAVLFQARVASATNGGTIEIYTDSLTGKLVGSLIVKGTNGWQNWTTNSCNISGVSGIHDIYFKFTGSRGFLLNLNWWKFKTK